MAAKQVEKVEKGKEYCCVHSRKGKFYVRALNDDDGGEWLDFKIIRGTANAVMAYNVKEIGERITLRRSHCYLTEMPQGKARVVGPIDATGGPCGEGDSHGVTQ